jgi:undecaprenyl-diphosphatase
MLAVSEESQAFGDIILHLGTLVAVLIYFKDDIIKLIKSAFMAIKDKNFSSEDSKLPFYLILGTIFTIIIAFPLNEYCEDMLSKPIYVGFFLIITGFILFFSEKISQKRLQNQKNNSTKSVTIKQAILIGIAQGIAALPGISRSGMTISTGLISGMDRVTAARYSFLLSIFIILGASVFYPIIKFRNAVPEMNYQALLLGFIVSTVLGYLCIKYFMKFLSKYSMKCFAYYCWIIGFCAIIFFSCVNK